MLTTSTNQRSDIGRHPGSLESFKGGRKAGSNQNKYAKFRLR